MTSSHSPVQKIEREPFISERVSRIGNAVALALIALSLAAQCLNFGIVLRGGPAVVDARLVTASEYLGAAIAPGMFVAFVKFLLMTIRSFRQREARRAALGYLLVLVFPVVGMNVIVLDTIRNVPGPSERPVPESEEFLNGRDWARTHKPGRGSECQGSSEFNRGCRAAIYDARHERFLSGREWAKQHRPTRPSECQGDVNFASGCQGYLFEQVDFFDHYVKPKDAKPSDYPAMKIATTEDCLREVDAMYRVVTGLEEQDGNYHAVSAIRRRQWEPERQNCERFDRVADAEILGGAYARLQKAVDRMKAGATLGEAERAAIEADRAAVEARRDQPYKAACIGLYDEYRQRLEGRYREPVIEHPKLSCDDYRAKIAEMAALDKQRSDRMRALKGEDGRIENAAEYDQLNRQRIDMMWDWKRYTDGAKANGCTLNQEER